MTLSLLAALGALPTAELTVLAQAVNPLDRDIVNRFLPYFPYQDVDSVRLADITTVDFRPVADRREWNANGRTIPLKAPGFRELEMTPIEANFKYDERVINRLAERSNGNQQIMLEIMRAEVPARVEVITDACYRRQLVDAFTAWATGTIVTRNPQDGTNYTTSYGLDATRYQTAGTAWDNAGVNAYTLLMSFLDSAVARVGPIEGVVMRRATQSAILADAPPVTYGVALTRGQLADKVSTDFGSPIYFDIIEESVDVFDDGGIATTRTNIWPAHKVAVIPTGKAVGRTARAPVRRAGRLVPGLGPDDYDVRGVTIFPEEKNSGKELSIQGQVNSIPVPNEQDIYVIDAGV